MHPAPANNNTDQHNKNHITKQAVVAGVIEAKVRTIKPGIDLHQDHYVVVRIIAPGRSYKKAAGFALLALRRHGCL
jgi:hypothetical protein